MALILYSCSLGDQSIPKGIIKINPMADILLDIAVAESYSESYILKDSTLNKDSVYKSEISKILQLHNTDPTVFSKSYNQWGLTKMASEGLLPLLYILFL